MAKTTIRQYSYWFLVPAGVLYFTFFLLPTLMSFFFSLTIWTLDSWFFTGLDNFVSILTEPSLNIGFRNTIIYAAMTCGLKVVISFFLAMFLCSDLKTKGLLRAIVFYPTILSTLAVGVIFSSLMDPSRGVFNNLLAQINIPGPNWLGDPNLALFSVIMTDVWKGVGVATVIFMAGIQAIPRHYYEAATIDGAGVGHKIRHITFPLARSSMNAIIMLAFIGGIRNFDLIWVMTGGGPGFSTDVIASIIFKQFMGGYYGISTAGNVIMFLLICVLVTPMYKALTSKEVDL